ncbi:MAG: PDZ domain-containing protein [Phycisphaera sp.]|nr:PDZ domain-containing protein [Phycisphaera sp.]
MSAIPGFILILVGFGFLIFIHELGHFLAAKWANIRADGFAIGMGPCVASYRRGIGFVLGSADAVAVRRHGRRPIEMSDTQREALGLGETEYSLRILPLGGYVRMLGQEDGNPAATSEDARSFGKATIFRRGVVILAGIAANLALAIVLFLVAFLVGVRFPAPMIGGVAADSPASRARALDAGAPEGIRAGDRVVAIDGEPAETFVDVRLAAAMAKPGETVALTVERGGKEFAYEVLPARDESIGLLSIGVAPARSATLTDVRASRETVNEIVAKDAPSIREAGVGAGWHVESVDGRLVGSFADLAEAARQSNGAPLSLVWRGPRIEDGDASGTAETSGTGATAVTVIEPRPEFELLIPAGGDRPEEALIGLVPLSRVRALVETSLNKGVLEEGDLFLRIGSLPAPRRAELVKAVSDRPNGRIPALVLRDGREVAVELRTNSDGRIGVELELATDLPLLANSIASIKDPAPAGSDPATRDTPAKALAPLPLGEIRSLDGEPVADFRSLRDKLVARARAHAGDAPLSVTIGLRDPSPEAAPVETTVALEAADLASLRALGHSFPLPMEIFDPKFTVLSADGNPLRAIVMGFRQTVRMVEQIFLTLDRVGRGSVGVEQLQGPVGILHTGTQVADEGFMYVLFFLALISVNLAVVNALPIPIADGGLFVFLIYEKLRGRPPSIAFQNAAAMAGIALVAGVFLLTFYNDIARIFGS